MSGSIEPVAIIGTACRLPGARNVAEYWRNLVDGKESISFLTADELRAAGVSENQLADENYVAAAPLMPDVDLFDAELFGMNSTEAALCDPQIRIFLELCHAGLENAGYDAFAAEESVGVFGTMGNNSYLRQCISRRPELVEGSAGIQLFTLNHADYLATFVSYKLNLRGPSLTVLTACSSSLVTVHLAAQALRSGECDMAIAGGVNIDIPVGHGYLWTPGGVRGPDGHCRPFDASAAGTVFGSGAGIVVLKRLDDAIAAGDGIRAVIRGSVVNNDGADKVSYSAPSFSGQVAAIVEAMVLAGVHPADVQYVEAHGTGTALGDPVEVGALAEAYRTLASDSPGAGRVAIGSVKSNIGHLNGAAGIAGLLKVVLMMEHETIVPSINIDEVNPLVELHETPFAVATELAPWPRRPGRTRTTAVSAFGVGGTNAHLVLTEPPAVAEVLPEDRTAPQERPQVLIWSGKTEEAVAGWRRDLAAYFSALGERDFADAVATLRHGRTPHPVRAAAVCTSAVDAVDALTDQTRQVHGRSDPDTGIAFVFPGHGANRPRLAVGLYGSIRSFTIAMDECLELFERRGVRLFDHWMNDVPSVDAQVGHPLLFSVEYAVAAMWRECGLEPDAVLGHSVGDLTAAAVAGVVDLADAVTLVTEFAVTDDPVADVRLSEEVGAITLCAPSVPIYSAFTGRRVTPAEASDHAFWIRRPSCSTGFRTALASLLGERDHVLLEVGPRSTLTSECAADGVASLSDGVADQLSVLRAATQLWVGGAELSWEAIGQSRPVRRIAVPGYPYQRRRHWIDPEDGRPDAPEVPTPNAADSPVATIEWIHQPRPAVADDPRGAALVLLPAAAEPALEVLRAVEAAGYRAVRVRPADHYEQDLEQFTVRLDHPDDMSRVLSTLDDRGVVLDTIIHAAGAGHSDLPGAPALDVADTSTHLLGRLTARHAVGRYVVVTAGSANVSGSERIEPSKATVHGLMRMLLAENPELRGGVIDVTDRADVAELAAELRLIDVPEVVALRGRKRWVPVERPLRLPAAGREVIRERGTYLITDGFSRLGLAVARKLATGGHQPRLALVGHCVRPRVDELIALGARVRAIAANVTDRQAVRAMVTEIESRFGPINGVFHLAGTVTGTAHLMDVLFGRSELDFAVFFSSKAAADGLAGGAEHAAASAFLDATAEVATATGSQVLSIGWPERLGDGVVDDESSVSSSSPSGQTWQAKYGASTHWVLDEHRLAGTPLMPTTALLDLAVTRFASELARPGQAIEVTDVVFPAPFLDERPRQLRVEYTPSPGGYEFNISTRVGEKWTTHASGHIASLAAEKRRVDPRRTRARLMETAARGAVQPFMVGPRWRNVVDEARAGDERLLTLELMQAFVADLAVHRLHPALLDTATAPVRDSGKGLWVPSLIRRIVVHDPLPARFLSHIRRQPAEAATVVGDIDLITEDGSMLAAIEGLAMRKIDTIDGWAPAIGETRSHRRARLEAAPATSSGLNPDEGVDLLMRLLAAGVSGAVRIRQVSSFDAATAATAHVEAELGRVWMHILGAARHHDDDDFFGMGGDSLAAVDLMARIRSIFGFELGVEVLNDASTFGALRSRIEERIGGC